MSGAYTNENFQLNQSKLKNKICDKQNEINCRKNIKMNNDMLIIIEIAIFFLFFSFSSRGCFII